MRRSVLVSTGKPRPVPHPRVFFVVSSLMAGISLVLLAEPQCVKDEQLFWNNGHPV